MNNQFQSSARDLEDIHVWLLDDTPATSQEFERYLKWISPVDRVMDIGSGAGRFLEVLRIQNIPAFGVDLNETLAARAQAKGSQVLTKDVLKALEEDAQGVTVFSMIDFVEHIPLPVLLEILEKISKIKGAKILLQTPNLESVIGMKFYFHLPSHVTPLHPFLLRRVLAHYGFEIVDEWTSFGELPWTGLRKWLVMKILNGLFGPPVAKMFFQGANVSMIAISKGK